MSTLSSITMWHLPSKLLFSCQRQSWTFKCHVLQAEKRFHGLKSNASCRRFASAILATKARSIDQLQSDAQANSSKYLNYLRAHNHPLPSHDAHSYDASDITLPEDIIEARNAAINACQEISMLLEGPARNIISGVSEQFMAVCLRIILRHEIPLKVPISGTISVGELATTCQLDKSDLLRVLKCSQAWHLFHVSQQEEIMHTAASRLLRENDTLRAWITNATEEVWSSIPHLVEAMAKWPGSGDPAQSAWTLSRGVNESAFSHWDKYPEIAAAFVTGMSYWNTAPGFEAHHILNQFDFSQLPAQSLFVDLGGSLGRTCIEVARRHPHVSTIVQDLPTTIESVPPDAVPVELQDRVRFMKHDIFKPQPVQGADIYYFRVVFHDWSDASCVEILRNLIPALKPGARILVTDTCLPRFGEVSMAEERRLRSLDLTVKAFANARERSEDDWRALFNAADERFGSFRVQLPQGSQRLALISVTWRPLGSG